MVTQDINDLLAALFGTSYHISFGFVCGLLVVIMVDYWMERQTEKHLARMKAQQRRGELP